MGCVQCAFARTLPVCLEAAEAGCGADGGAAGGG